MANRIVRSAHCHAAWLVIATSALVVGCQASQVRRDGVNFRQTLEDMYTEQAMDNLVRARLGLPFVQLAYRDLLIQGTDFIQGTGGTNGAFVGIFLQTFSLGSQASRQKIMSFYADPVTNQNDIYDTYLKYARNPAFLIVSDKPPPCPVHISRCFNNLYFWIPVEAAPQFLELVLKTTLKRGTISAPSLAWETTILAVVEQAPQRAQGKNVPNRSRVLLYLADPVPNDSGVLIGNLFGKPAQFTIVPALNADESLKSIREKDLGADLGAMTHYVIAILPVPPDLKPDIANKQVSIYSSHNPKPAPPLDIGQQIYHSADRIRAQAQAASGK